MANKDDFMGGMFDFNGDGHTDAGEEFIAYQMFEDCTRNTGSSDQPPTSANTHHTPVAAKPDHFWIVYVILFGYAILKGIAGIIYH